MLYLRHFSSAETAPMLQRSRRGLAEMQSILASAGTALVQVASSAWHGLGLQESRKPVQSRILLAAGTLLPFRSRENRMRGKAAHQTVADTM